MLRITISYRRDDSLDITGRIFDRLAGHFGREAVFRDIDSIPPGADFRRHIDRVFDESDIILAIVGPRWIGPDNEQLRLASPADPVRLEIETALRKKKPLIPVLVSRAVMPHPDVLPDSLHDFVYRNAVQVDSGQDFDVHVGRLIRAIERLLRIDEEHTADAAVQGVIPAIKAAPPIAPTPKAEPPVDPVAPPIGRPVRADGGHTIRWAVGLGLVVILGVIGASGWWVFLKQPTEMARKEPATAEKPRVEEQDQGNANAKNRLAALGREVRSFTLIYEFQPDPGLRSYSRDVGGVWHERYPSGREMATLSFDRREVVKRCNGSVVRKNNAPGFEMFIPDLGCDLMLVWFRWNNGEWKELGQMNDIN